MTREERAACKRCDRPRATDADWRDIPEGEGADLCWGDVCEAAPWRDRALAAELRVAELTGLLSEVLADRGPGFHDLPECGCCYCRAGRAIRAKGGER